MYLFFRSFKKLIVGSRNKRFILSIILLKLIGMCVHKTNV